MADTLPGSKVQVRSYGNVLAAMCALHGLAANVLSQQELDRADPDFEVIVP